MAFIVVANNLIEANADGLYLGVVLSVGDPHVAVEGGSLAGDALLGGEGLFYGDLGALSGVGGWGLDVGVGVDGGEDSFGLGYWL